MPQIFVLNGLPGVGKTTFGQMTGEELQKEGINFLHTSSIDPIKHLLRPTEMWDRKVINLQLWEKLEELKRKVTDRDWDGVTKDVYWRGVMSQFKAEITQFDPSLIHQWVLSRALQVPDPAVVFVDIREGQNINDFKEYCSSVNADLQVRTICVVGDRHDEYDNLSDALVMDYQYDIQIENYLKPYEGNEEASQNALREETRRFLREEIRPLFLH